MVLAKEKWPTLSFGKVAEFKNGLNFGSKEAGYSLKVLGVGDFQRHSTLDETDHLATIHTNREINSSYYLEKGDLVFVRSNGNKALVGRCLLIRTNGEPISYSGFTIRARITNKNLKPEFVNLLIQSGLLKRSLKKEGAGTNISNLNQGILSKLEVFVPTPEEQEDILGFFENFTQAIEKTEALIRAKQQQFSWLRSNIIRNAKNTAPSHFGDFLKESRVPDALNDAKKRLTVRLHLKGVDVREYRGTEADGATQYFVRKAGQLVYGKQNIFRGSIGIVPDELNGYSSSQDIPAFDIADNVDAEWLFWYMSRPSFYEKLEHFASGSGSKRLHPKELFKMPIKLPPLPEQKRIAHTLNTAQAEIRLLQQLAKKHRTQKRGLMQKLLTGEWRVGSDKEAAA